MAVTLRTLEENLGDACVAAYGTVTGAPLPVPALVIPPSGSSVVVDCGDLLIVRAASVSSAFQGPPEKCALVMVANLEVTVTRCIPNLTDWGHPATQAELTAAGLSLADDVSTLWYGVAQACQAGTLWAGFADLGCADTQFRAWTPGASGGIGWWSWQVSVNVTGPLT